ncbi:osmoprotectant ABC transporter substrate-binding protein [Kurthia sp. FSL E2-0154]|uniref:osmoprotectant ABC transporter substrate-binding protein n=1 Tax=Kurthia sp. FSL E2-0154 TaxID=2921358 RepID=UPI0030F9CCE0
MRRLKWIVFICSIMLILSACSSGKDETIKIATVTTTESAIMGNMVKLMIEHYTDENVQMINNLGSSVVVHQAMLNGDANISATRYTGTDLTGALGQEAIKDPEEAMKKVQELFQKDYDQTFFDSYGFANTYAFMVSKETAKKYNLKKVSDLRKVADKMQAGVDTSWMNRPGDGYKAFVKEYGFDFNKVYPMQIGLVYDAVEAGKMDVVLGYTTDGRISSYDLVVLEDDLNFFPPYDCSPLATNELLKTHPEVKKILEKLVDKVSTEEMQKLNYESDNNLLEPAVVAQHFLEKHNYFDDKGGE